MDSYLPGKRRVFGSDELHSDAVSSLSTLQAPGRHSRFDTEDSQTHESESGYTGRCADRPTLSSGLLCRLLAFSAEVFLLERSGCDL